MELKEKIGRRELRWRLARSYPCICEGPEFSTRSKLWGDRGPQPPSLRTTVPVGVCPGVPHSMKGAGTQQLFPTILFLVEKLKNKSQGWFTRSEPVRTSQNQGSSPGPILIPQIPASLLVQNEERKSETRTVNCQCPLLLFSSGFLPNPLLLTSAVSL